MRIDTLLVNGRFWTGLGRPRVSAVAIADGRIVGTGAGSDFDSLITPATRRIDLGGRFAAPGFNDGHQHTLAIGQATVEVDVKGETRLDAVLAAIKARTETLQRGSWVIGRGYDHFLLDTGQHPSRADLDAAAPHHPVFLKRTCGHLAVVNSAAMAVAGVSDSTPDPAGGLIEKRDGVATGLVAETALQLFMRVLPPLSEAELVTAIEAGGRLCLARGITSVMDAAVGNRQGYDDVTAWYAAYAAGRLPLRARLCFTGGPGGTVDQAYAQGLVTGVGDDWLRAGPVKLFTDGSAGGRTAAMTAPYLGGCDCGILCLTADTIREIVIDLHAKGYQMGIHAIGDKAIGHVIDAVVAAQARTPRTDTRHRIEHCGFATGLQIARMSRLGMVPVPQPVFLWDFGDLYLDVVGAERSNASYPMRAFIDAGLHPVASSDAPVCTFDPFPNLAAMLTRQSRRGAVLGAAQAISLDEALSAMTANGARAEFMEDRKGCLAPGHYADIAVWDHDPFTSDADRIREGRVVATILDGKVVHDTLGLG